MGSDVGAGRSTGLVRPEIPDDRDAIRSLLRAAFDGDQEASLVDQLRQDGDLAVSLVAMVCRRVVGHAALSRLRSPASGIALAPVAVDPSIRRKGIGSALVAASLDHARRLPSMIVFVLGDPHFYSRFGFSLSEAARFTSPYSGPHFLACRLSPTPPAALRVIHAPSFDRLS